MFKKSAYEGGSHLTQRIWTSYDQMVKALGQPTNGMCDGYKVDVTWELENEDGDILMIWNFKNGPNYQGCGTLEDIDHFSCYYLNPVVYEQLETLIAENQ